MSTGLSGNLTAYSTSELERLRGKLRAVKSKRAELVQLSRAEFLATYPTPGALAADLSPRLGTQTPALEAIDRALVALRDAPEDRGRQMIFVPPQEGKSTRTSCWFPLWMLAQDPTLRIAIVSYSATKAERWGRWLRRAIEAWGDRLGIALMPDSRAVDRFETTAGGSVISVGVGGGITGEPVDVMVIDDPVRGRAEAESSTYRQAAYDWWESNGATRLSARGRVVLMMTRWHADDLAGRLLKEEPDTWSVLRIPAVRDRTQPLVRGTDGASVYSPQGELISVQRRRPGYYIELKVKRSLYVWNSIYMQTPVAAEGNLFHRADFRFWWPLPQDPSHHDPTGGRRIRMPDDTYRYVGDMSRFITMDLAASTKTSADYTAVCVWGITLNGELILLDSKRERIGESAHWDLLRPFCEVWACPTVYVEKGFIGSTLVIDATRNGIRVLPVTPDTDKITRAIPATQRVASHTVLFPADAPWLEAFLDEIAGFPSWAHDDWTDNLSYASRITSAHWTPPPLGDPPKHTTSRTDADTAYEASTGLPGGLDLSTAEW